MPLSTPDHPICHIFRIVFEFYLNDNEEEKQRSINRVLKEARKKFNLSVTTINDTSVENPERGVVVGSLCAKNKFYLGEQKNKLMEYFDQEMPARIILEDHQTIEIE
ncbi:MAG: hypothetical protein M9962_08355 [Oligoflexia bacterium]|nr:hypothetical protein [Oligoflexia bacterium]